MNTTQNSTPANNCKLIPGNGCVHAAKNIRIELKAAFPETKFSVRSESYSMGNAIRIGWTDGPTSAQVEAISDKYEAGHFGCDEHGNQDIYTYSKNAQNYGSAKYISTNRELSDSFRAELIEGVAKHYGDQNKPTVEQWKNGEAWNVSPLDGNPDPHWCWQGLLYRSSVHSTPGSVVPSDY